ncbi:MAG TPA: hypothetical protein PKX40_10845 [Spirochaetota bacterium]|mgnify:FL=1|nr:hypothetical protein [Spirochaetota bacterium]
MKHRSQIHVLMSIIIAMFFFSDCSDSEPRTGLLGQTSTVIINLGLPNDHAADTSIIDKVRRFFARDAIAQTAPAAFNSVKVRVTAADIGIIEKEFNPYGTISLNVPAGNLRQFEVIAYVAPTPQIAALSFSGTAITNLTPGDTVSIPVMMRINETKIVVPDAGNTGIHPGRIIMFNNISDAASTWIAQTTFPGFSGTLRPFDIDFDARGRIYIANYSNPGMIRIDDMNGTNLIQGSTTNFEISNSAINSVVTVAVDKINNVVYFAQVTALYRSNLDGIGTEQLSLTGTGFGTTYYIKGIDVDNTGMLYIVGPNNTFGGPPQLIKYNPNTQQIMGSPYSIISSASNISQIYDVLFRNPFVYVANFGGSDGNQILQLSYSNSTFNLVANNGTKNTTTPERGNFYGASRFLAIRNDVFIIADSGQATITPDYDQIVSFGDILFTTWAPFGSYGTGPNQFILYSQC